MPKVANARTSCSGVAATAYPKLADVNVPWDDLGPWSVVAAGVVVLLVGAIGLRSSRARH